MSRQNKINKLIRIAVIVGSVGLSCLLIYLIVGFQPWSVGVGIFLGFPLLTVALVLYIVAVIKDLKRHEVVSEE